MAKKLWPDRNTRGPLSRSLWDYYETSREYTKENDERAKDMDKSWRTSEKIYLGIIIVGGILIVIKYFIL